jgi:tripartite-type tricarboxylate transporter receptor subunit TctC
MHVKTFRAVLLIAAGALSITSAIAQAPASKTVRIVVPFPPGGGNDMAARILAPSVGRAIGQNVIVDNRPGGTTVIGTSLVARAPADGNTLLVVGFSWFSNAALRTDLPFDTLKDFAGVARFDNSPFLISVHPSLPVKSVKELIALARARPGQLAYASNGNGTAQHLTGEWLKLMTGIDLLHVPYQGGAPSLTAVMGGHAPILISTIPTAAGALAAGKLRPLGVTSRERAELLKDVPTLSESGMREFELSSNLGIVAPAATPRETINRLGTEFTRAMQAPDVRENLIKASLYPAPSTPEQYDAVIRGEVRKIQKIVREAKVRLEP